MEDEADFAQFTASAIQEAATEAKAEAVTTPVPASEPEKVEAKTEETPKAVEVEKPPEKTEDKPDWKKAAAAERDKRAAKESAKQADSKKSAEYAAMAKELARYKAIEAKKATDPLEAAREFGLDYDLMTKEYIKSLDKPAEVPNNEIKQLIQKIQQIESQLEQQQQEKKQRENQDLVNSFEVEVQKTVETKAEDFELLAKAEEGPELVKQIVAAHWKQTQEIMPTEEACKLAEEYLDKQLQRFKGTKKFGAKVAAPKPVAKPPAEVSTLSQSLRQGGETLSVPHGDEVEQLLALKKQLESQLS